MTRAGIVAGVASLVALAGTWVAWNDTATATNAPVPAATALDGAQLFSAKGCAGCHDGPDSTARVQVGPSLRHAATWAASRRPGLSGADYIAESILAPGAFISPAFHPNGPVARMPTLGLTTEEVDALVAYLLDA